MKTLRNNYSVQGKSKWPLDIQGKEIRSGSQHNGNNRKWFIFTFYTKLIDGVYLRKYLGTLTDMTSVVNVLSGEYTLSVDGDLHI